MSRHWPSYQYWSGFSGFDFQLEHVGRVGPAGRGGPRDAVGVAQADERQAGQGEPARLKPAGVDVELPPRGLPLGRPVRIDEHDRAGPTRCATGR